MLQGCKIVNIKDWDCKKRMLNNTSQSVLEVCCNCGTPKYWNMRCYGGVTGSHVQENVRDAKAGDNPVPYTDSGPAAGDHKV